MKEAPRDSFLFVGRGEQDGGGAAEQVADLHRKAVLFGLMLQDASAEASDVEAKRSDRRVEFRPGGGLLAGGFLFHRCKL